MNRFYTLLAAGIFLTSSLTAQELAYYPSAYWQVKNPAVKNSTAYPFRNFFPQYGFPARLVAGKWDAGEWERWKKQNNFSAPYALNGHSWQLVVESNKAIFQQHPEYLAEVNGKRLGYGKTTKFCVSNKDLQALFIQDRIAQFQKQNDGNGAVSVEPSDGAGFCECENCKKLGTISDQVFFLANLTAKALRNRFPNGKVNLLAYYLHAETPHFDLEPNVHVTVVPEGFQSVYDADAMLSIWSKKATLRTYYEYFAIPQWTGNLPRLNVQNYLRRMQLAKKLGYQGYWFETGSSINTIIALQLFNQLWLNPDLTWEDVSEKFLRTCFKESYQPMKELFTRWWHTWMPEEEIPMAVHNLNQATALARSPDERERLNDLKAYLHYIILFQEWNKDRNDRAVTDALFTYVYNAANRMVLHAPAFYSIYNKHLDETGRDRFNLYKKNSWAWLTPLTAEQIEKNFREDLKEYGTKQNTFVYTDMKKGLATVLKKRVAQQQFQFASRLSEKMFFYGKGVIKIKLINPIDIAAQSDTGLYLSILGSDGALIARKFISYKKPELTIQLPKADMYGLSLLQFFSTGLEIDGAIVPVLTFEQKKRLQNDKKIMASQRIDFTKQPEQTSYYFVTPRS